MNKRIVILEPSEVIQKFFRDAAEGLGFEPVFEPELYKFMRRMFSDRPDAMLVNVDVQDSLLFATLRLLKTLPALKKVPLALYSTAKIPFEQYLLKNCGGDSYFRFNAQQLSDEVGKILEASGSDALNVPVINDVMKNAILMYIFNITRNLDSTEKTAGKFLSLLSEFCEVPAAAVCLLEHDGPHGYYTASAKFTPQEKDDFLATCRNDFGKNTLHILAEKLRLTELKPRSLLDTYRTGDVPLSAYQTFRLTGSDKNIIGTIHVVKEGRFTKEQLDLLQFCAANSCLVFENAIAFKKRLSDEQQLRGALEKFVPQHHGGGLSESVAASGEKRTVAVLSAAIRPFDVLCALNSPEAVTGFLNQYFTLVANIVKKYDGFVDKCVDNTVAVLFGVSDGQEGLAQSALAAAGELRAAVTQLASDALVLPEGIALSAGIGLSYGEAVVGSFGPDGRTAFSAVGGVPELALRLNGLAELYGVPLLASQAVKNAVPGEEGSFRYLDDIKAGNAAVAVYALDENPTAFSDGWRDNYLKGMKLYKEGVFNLAKDYFEKTLAETPGDAASRLLLERCKTFIKNPPENWDGTISCGIR